MKKVKENNEYNIINKYFNETFNMIRRYYPQLQDNVIRDAIYSSINKRLNNHDCKIINNYMNAEVNTTLLDLTEFINDKKPIVTAYGAMFTRHGTRPNPLLDVIKTFLKERSIYKEKMFMYEKGTEEREDYSLLQILSKIDANGLYGTFGMPQALIFNIYVAASITAQARALISSATMQFEMFLANSVKFSSLNEVITFIDNIISEKKDRKFSDMDILDDNIPVEKCFSKVILSCGYRWIPNKKELEIIWNYLNKLSVEDINRIYYKNNLFEFMSNKSMVKAFNTLMEKMDEPYLNPKKVPKSILAEIDAFSDLLSEYVYYHYMIIDRIDRCDNMIKSISLISDTDSAIISLDGWYRYGLELIKGNKNISILHGKVNLFEMLDDSQENQLYYMEDQEYDFSFESDDLINKQRSINMFEMIPEDNVRYTIINIMAYVLDKIINDYMLRFTKNSNSYRGDDQCMIILKNEFLFKRALLTQVKKHYATIQEIQEGNHIPQNIDTALDVKGIDCMAKSVYSEFTRKELKKILYDDILNTQDVDQLKVIKDLAILEKKIIKSIANGSKEYYKPAVIKSASAYVSPMSIQGIKGAVVWNKLKDEYDEQINMNERNAIDIAKISITPHNIEIIKDEFPDTYDKCKALFTDEYFKDKKEIESISIPKDTPTPKWLLKFIDYNTIVNNNLGGFPIESIGCSRFGNTKVNYSNIVKL